MRDGTEHAAAEVLHNSSALVGVPVCRHDRIAHELLGERAGQPILLGQVLNLQSRSALGQEAQPLLYIDLSCMCVPRPIKDIEGDTDSI